MPEHDTRKSRGFGRWLKFKRGKMLQSEAVQRMIELHNIKVTVETWSRWETGMRLPPEKKIDAIADAVEAARERARRLAGYKAPIKGQNIGQSPIDLVQKMLQEVMQNRDPEMRMHHLYVLLYVYFNQHKSGWHLKLGKDLELMKSIARVYETLNDFPPDVQIGALRQIKTICENAWDMPLKGSPADMATLIFPKDRNPPVQFGTKIAVICAEGAADEATYNYMVDEVRLTDKKEVVATLSFITTRRQ
jgi:hypothetical protein